MEAGIMRGSSLLPFTTTTPSKSCFKRGSSLQFRMMSSLSSAPKPLLIRAAATPAPAPEPTPTPPPTRKPTFVDQLLSGGRGTVIPIMLSLSCLLVNYAILRETTAGRDSAQNSIASALFSPKLTGIHSAMAPMPDIGGRAFISFALYLDFALLQVAADRNEAKIFDLRKLLGRAVANGWAFISSNGLMISIALLLGLLICFFYWLKRETKAAPNTAADFKNKEEPKMETQSSQTKELAALSLPPLNLRWAARLVSELWKQPVGSFITLIYASGLIPRNVDLERSMQGESKGREN